MTKYFTRPMRGTEGTNYFCASGSSIKDIYFAEKCICKNPYKCKCKVISPPQDYPQKMEETLFHNPRPMLLWTIYNLKDSSIKISFGGKIEQEVFDEVKRLNSFAKKELWSYKEEETFNILPKSEYEKFKNLYEV